MSASVRYRIKHYDLNGDFQADITEASDRTVSMPLNNAFSGSFSLFLDDPLVAKLKPLQSVIKLWRDVQDAYWDVHFTMADDRPLVAGYISSRRKEGNKIIYTFHDPIWKTQFHFHLLNHRIRAPLKVGPGLTTVIPCTLSGLIWKCIDLVQNAFGLDDSELGMRLEGTDTGSDTALFDGVYRIPQGSWTWDQHCLYLLNQENGVDLHLDYEHNEGSPILARFFCDHPSRGTDKSDLVQLEYGEIGTGYQNNIEELDFDEVFEPKRWANWWRQFGQGQKDTTFSWSEPISGASTGPLGISTVGIYMGQDKQDNVVSAAYLQGLAKQNLKRSSADPSVYSLTLDPTGPPYFWHNFVLGDLIQFRYKKGNLVVPATKERIYQVDLSLSDNNMELCKVLIAPDFLVKVPQTVGG